MLLYCDWLEDPLTNRESPNNLTSWNSHCPILCFCWGFGNSGLFLWFPWNQWISNEYTISSNRLFGIWTWNAVKICKTFVEDQNFTRKPIPWKVKKGHESYTKEGPIHEAKNQYQGPMYVQISSKKGHEKFSKIQWKNWVGIPRGC